MNRSNTPRRFFSRRLFLSALLALAGTGLYRHKSLLQFEHQSADGQIVDSSETKFFIIGGWVIPESDLKPQKITSQEELGA